MARAGRPRIMAYREPSGRPVRKDMSERQIEVMRSNLEQRCRQMEWLPTPKNLKRVRAEHFCCEAGREIERGGFDADLWTAAKHVFKIHHNYRVAIGAPNPNITNNSISMIPEVVEATANDDGQRLLSDEEWAERSKSSYETMVNWLSIAGFISAKEVSRVVIDDVPCQNPEAFRVGLSAVANGITGRRRLR